jgi:hypothetical protein
MPEATIEMLEKQYETFAATTKKMVKRFEEGGYNTFIDDCGKEDWFKRDFIQNNLAKISKAYAFVKLLKDIYDQEFVQDVLRFAESRGFLPRDLITQRAEPDWILAWNLAVHYSLWGWNTYDNLDFVGIGFKRVEPRPGYGWFAFVGFVPILDIKLDQDGRPIIKPYEWKTIRISLQSMDKRD